MNINDPASGLAADVSNGQLHTYACCESRMVDVSKRESLAYSWCAVSADLAATINALVVKNTSSDKKLHITKVYCWADVATQFKIHCPATAGAAGTLVTAVNLNRSSTTAAEALAYANDTTAAFVAANTILTMRNNETATDEFGVEHDFGGALILGLNDQVAVYLVADTGAFECTVFGYYE